MIRTALAMLGIVLVLGFVGKWDYEDAKAQDQHYTNMVCEGYWPDYDNREPECD